MAQFSYEKLNDKINVCISKEHRFGTDAFLLADFSAPRQKDLVCDLGTGCGIIPLAMSKILAPKIIYAVDVQAGAVEQLNMGIHNSLLDNQIIPVCADLKELPCDMPFGRFDVVTCNPPYKAAGCGIESEPSAQKIARHEILCNINDVCRTGARLLKFSGKLCICNRPERLADVISAMKDNGIEPKTLRFVSKTPKDAPWLFLIEGRKGGKPFLNVLPQLYVRSGDGFTEEILAIYKKGGA